MLSAELSESTSGLRGVVKDGQVYRCGKLAVAPLQNDSLLGYVYLRLEDECLLPNIFSEGVPNLTWFLKTFTDPSRAVLGCWEEDESGDVKLQGFTWFNTAVMMGKFRKHEVGAAFFRHAKSTVELGKLSIHWAFEELDSDVLYCTTPELNRAAVNYISRLGFSQRGEVDGFTCWRDEMCAAKIGTYTRSRWEAEGESNGRSKN